MLSHLDDENRPTMVDVSAKAETDREATAESVIELPAEVYDLLNGDEIQTKKGPVIATAIIAGTMAVKKTWDLIPFCHPIPIDSIKFSSTFDSGLLTLRCTVKNRAKTGIEMEALMGVSVAALTVYDMCKAMSHAMIIRQTRLLQKSGGKRDVVIA